MTTLFGFAGTTYGALFLILAALALSGAGFFYWRRRKEKLSEQRKQEDRQNALAELSKQEKEAAAHYKSGKYQLAEAHFRAAAAKAEKLGEQQRQWKYQHHAFIAMSKTESFRVLPALQALQKLVAELKVKLSAKDPLLLMAEQNLGKIEKHGLNAAAESEFKKAGEHYDAEKLDQAKLLYEQAFRAAQHAKNPILCALILNDCSRVLARKKQFADAIKMLEKAKKIAEANCEAGHELPANIAWNMEYYHGIEQETHVKDLLARVRAAHKTGKHEDAMELADKAVSEAFTLLKGDHWLSAEALHHRACVKMGQGFYSDARGDFDQALAILSEWPEQCAKLIELANTNLEKCRNDMGY